MSNAEYFFECPGCGHRHEIVSIPSTCPACGCAQTFKRSTEAEAKTSVLDAKFRLAAEKAKGNF